MDNFKNRSDLYKKMIEEIQDYAIILLDKNGIIMNWNKGAEKIKKYKDSEIIGKHFSVFYLKEDFDDRLPQKLLNEASLTGRAIQEGWRKRKDDSRFWASVTITALHDENNSVIGYCKVTRDLTEKKNAEDSLRLSEERYHQMIAEVQDYAIILLSIEGIIENWNAGAEKIKGYSSKEAIGKKFEMFYTDEDKADNLPAKLLNRAKETGKALQEGWRVRKDKSKFWGSITITALHNKAGHVIGYSKVTRDLTTQKLNEETTLKYTKELEIQNIELEQFAYVASHDLQEPLRKIQTFADLIRKDYKNEELVKTYFSKLETSAKRMSELIKSLLSFSHLTSGSDRPEMLKVDLNKILDLVTQDFELLINEKNAIIESEILPVVEGYETQLVQLFSNIISNSIKFSDKQPVIKISVEKSQKEEFPNVLNEVSEKEYWQITFTDNGIGFDQKFSNIIFSLFQRLHDKNSYEGTGIGLALCRRIVENHNGTIDAHSELGNGATFIISLPVVND